MINNNNLSFQKVCIDNADIQAVYIMGINVWSSDNNIENSYAKNYLNNTDYSSDEQYEVSYIQNYQPSPVEDESTPKPIRLSWEHQATTSIRIELDTNNSFSNPWVYDVTTTKDFYYVYNLIPQQNYYYRITNLTSSQIIKSGEFTTDGMCRMIKIFGNYVGNFRDIGGWSCGNDKRIKYGRLIRGAEVYRNDQNIYIEISNDGIVELRDRIGCTVELDFGDFWNQSPLEGQGFEVFANSSLYGFYAYDRPDKGLRSEIGRQLLSNCLSLIFTKLGEGKSIYYHCNSGADRTGTISFIMESLCGVSEGDLAKDYELTSLWACHYLSGLRYMTRKRNISPDGDEGYGYKTMVEYIKSTFNGSTLNEKVYNMCILPIVDGGLGLTQNQINDFRNIMIEDI